MKRLPMIVMPFLLAACSTVTHFSTPQASGHYVVGPMQCVPYARQVSGIQLYGDAHTWWDKAYPRYHRGNRPQIGSVLVLSRTPRMTHGHVAVVKKIVSNREIDVTHSNWGDDFISRRVVYESARVADISPRNDWTQVKFWNYDKNCFGFPYAAKGFIYR